MTPRLWGLDLVRAFAIVMVLLAHGFQSCYSLGFWGVEVFFALSGYLIGGILVREVAAKGEARWGWRDLLRFWQRRWFRTLPNYYFYLGLSLLAAGESLRGRWPYLLFCQNLQPGQMGDFFGISWSLSVEEWFYITFPLLLVVLSCWIGSGVRRGFVGAAVLLVLIPIGLRVAANDGAQALGWDVALRKVVPFRLDAILWGVLAAYLRYRVLASREDGKKIAILGIALLGLDLGLGCFPGMAQNLVFLNVRLTAVPLGVALILPALETCAAPRWGGSSVEWISRLSYSLYLSHALVIGWVVTQPFYIEAGVFGKLVCKVLQYAAIAGLSAATYRWIEKPFLRLRDRVAASPT